MLAARQGGPIPVGFVHHCSLPAARLLGDIESQGDLIRVSVDLVAASIDASRVTAEHAIFREDFVNCRAPTRRVVLTDDLVKIAGEQGQYAAGHGC
jgi:hypothetical protein